MLHKWMPRDNTASPQQLLSQPASLQRNRSGIFAGRILLVEDCEVTRLASELLLQQQGLCIDTATSGEEAMEMLSRNRDYDLILVDIHMPGLSGYALCSWYKEMCKTEGRATGIVVAVTADPDDQTCKEFGIDKCLPKPLSTSTIVNLLHEHWGEREARKSSSPGLVAFDWGEANRSPQKQVADVQMPPAFGTSPARPPAAASTGAGQPPPFSQPPPAASTGAALPPHLQHLQRGGGGGGAGGGGGGGGRGFGMPELR